MSKKLIVIIACALFLIGMFLPWEGVAGILNFFGVMTAAFIGSVFTAILMVASLVLVIVNLVMTAVKGNVTKLNAITAGVLALTVILVWTSEYLGFGIGSLLAFIGALGMLAAQFMPEKK
ncbi:MAG: hypothetical protein IKL75_04300 [Bacteroidaceae bacterium]|nr:hypothetical protein [Bacteroidaceae bacterium]